MSKIKLTPQQAEATENTGGALLVSAAAGSGKTRVLVERIIKKIERGDDIDDFLIITYTKAAAAEMRGRILDSVYELIAKAPENKRFRRQADICGKADIGTIHSFCAGIIRENAHLLGLNPDFRVIDESESGLIKNEVLFDLLEEYYNDGDPSFLLLADTMGAGRDDSRLVGIVLDTYSKLMSHPYPEKWAREQMEYASLKNAGDAMDTPWGTYIAEKTLSWAEYWKKRLEKLFEEAAACEDFLKAYKDSLNATYKGLIEFIGGLKTSWSAAKEAADIPFLKVKPVKGYEDFKAVRQRLKKEHEKIRKPFETGSDKLLSDMSAAAPVVKALLRFVLKFKDEYSQKKRKRNVLDFSDQEHMALALLINSETGEVTDAARQIASRYKEVLVDEYQDVNAVQEMIFKAVSKDGQNIFMVGDVKQSIYRFRLADPTIFIDKYRNFKEAGNAPEGQGRKILLSSNFRSKKGVLDAVNFTFKNVMREGFGDIEYTEREYLCHGAEDADNGESAVELDVLNMAESDDETAEKTEAEAEFIAGRIKELSETLEVSDGKGGLRKAVWGDFAILLRAVGQKAPKYAAALAKYGIPSSFETGANFFETTEISLAVSLLTVIDNPRQDVPLISVLKSPLYGFTADELGTLRAEKKDGDFYSALIKASEKDEKSAGFIKALDELRALSCDMTSDELLWHIYNNMGFLAVMGAMPGGERRRRNLMQLFEYAKKFESAGYKGLFGFMTYLRGLMERGESPEAVAAFVAENAVSIMSIHKSKGLEFPVVFIADMAKRFNTDDAKKPLLIHAKLGIGPMITDSARRLQYPTLSRMAVSMKITEESLSEELRVLYVAMTRAREKLIMVASFANAERELSRNMEAPLPVPSQLSQSARSMADWVLMPALKLPEATMLRFGEGFVPADYDGEKWDIRLISPEAEYKKTAGSETVITENTDISENTYRAIERCLDWSYEYSENTKMPSKLTATELKGMFYDAEASENAEKIVPVNEKPPRAPSFMTGRRPLTAAEKGTAAHMVMQYADHSKCETLQGVKGEIERLKNLEIITEDEAKAVDPGIIYGFFESEPGRALKNAKNVRRELKFSLLVKSEDIEGLTPGEQILLQGVVDCCFEEDDGLTIIDFKTDFITEDTLEDKCGYYKGQIAAYSLSMERVLKKPVKRRILYFLTAGLWREV